MNLCLIFLLPVLSCPLPDWLLYLSRIHSGKEKLRYTVVLAVRGDGQKVKPRIIYKGSPFIPGKTRSGKPTKPATSSLSYHHLPANRTKYGYPAAGIGLGVQKSSWCDARQTDIWLTEEFMRRPDASGFSQPVSILTMDDFKCHKDEEFQKKLKERAKTEPIMIPGGLTPVVQPLDRTINKEFKRGMRAKYTHWRKEEFERLGAAGKIEAPGRGIVAMWVKDVWGSISAETIRTCFKACGLTLNLDGSEDHEWCLHTFGEKYRDVLVDQREVWEKAHGVELEPLQLPVIPPESGEGKARNAAVEATCLPVTIIDLDCSDDEAGIIEVDESDEEELDQEDESDTDTHVV